MIYRFEMDFDDGAMLRMVIWQIPAPIPPSIHPYKYRLVYLENGRRIIGFDNERGKGDHRHAGSKEMPYVFKDVSTLLQDFTDRFNKRRSP